MGVKPPSESKLSLLAPALLAGCAALWVGPDWWRPLGLGLGAILVAWAATRPVARAAPAAWHVALAGLLIASCLALYPSIDLDASLSRLHGVVLGVATFGCAVHWVGSVERLRWAGTLLSLLLAGVVVAGVLLTEWPSGGEKGLPVLTRVSERLDGLALGLPLAPERGVNPNKLAAPLAMLVPPVAGGALAARGRWRRLFGGGVAVLAVLLLVLTQSRSAYLAVGGGMLVLLAAHSRRLALWLVPLLVLVAGVAWWGFGPGGELPGPLSPAIGDDPTAMSPGLASGSRSAGLSLEFRRRVWGLAGEMVRDFPFTGIGLGTFPLVAEVLYGSALLYGPEVELPHAHNLVLQVAVDLGLPGLALFALLTACGAVAAYRAIAGAPSAAGRAPLAGAAGGLLAYYLYGLTDAIGMGEKPGLVFWILLAVVGAGARLPALRAAASPKARQARA